MDIPEGHPSGFDVRAFMQEVEPRFHEKLEKEILALNGIKFQLALKVQLRKDNADGSEHRVDRPCAAPQAGGPSPGRRNQ